MTTLFTVLHIVIAVLLVVMVLLQEGKDPGMRGISGSTPDGDSFFSKNSGRTKASMLSKLTATLAVLFLVTTLVLVFTQM
ncbi:MAG: preprotein translocase subunit SecG [Clostridia bacterium]|nr:preprotein translocase subunit SecG [Clostridia bacterium]MBQ8637518.1 preprotein translocase subunit SecG [Clostridia bacterium]